METLTETEKARLMAVEQDVRQAIKEALDSKGGERMERIGAELLALLKTARKTGALLLLVSLIALAGCTSSAGWRVSFGIAPVTSIDDNQQLTAARTEVRK
jgi:hypothetical protein